MNRIVSLFVTLAVVGLLAGAPVAADNNGPNPEQSGDNSDCLDFLVLYQAPGVHSPLAAMVEVEGNTSYVVSHEHGAAVYVDFYNEAGEFLTYNAGSTEGNVPSDASYALICVGSTGLDWPAEAPEPFAHWTYQDGFPPIEF